MKPAAALIAWLAAMSLALALYAVRVHPPFIY